MVGLPWWFEVNRNQWTWHRLSISRAAGSLLERAHKGAVFGDAPFDQAADTEREPDGIFGDGGTAGAVLRRASMSKVGEP